MEDDYFVSLDGDFAAVFDGHGGFAVSRYLRKNLYANVQAVLPVLSPVTTSSVASSRFEHEESLWTTTGSAAADFNTKTQATLAAAELHRAATSNAPTWQDYETALETALEKVDREVQRISHWSYQGSTAVVIWIHEEKRPTNSAATLDGPGSPIAADAVDSSTNSTNNDSNRIPNQRTIIAANVGDSRAVLCRNNTAWELTRDHKPNHPMERSRIEKLGGKVVWCGDVDKEGNPIPERGIYRVNGNLALSRAIGDRSERPHVTAEPEIIAIPVLDEEDEFIIVATDGLWDVLESNEAVDLVQQLVQQGLARDQVATWLVEESIRRGTYDNVTVVIIWLDRSCSTA
jgi:protein phosphatase 1L